MNFLSAQEGRFEANTSHPSKITVPWWDGSDTFQSYFTSETPFALWRPEFGAKRSKAWIKSRWWLDCMNGSQRNVQMCVCVNEREYLIETGLMEGLTTARVVTHLIWDRRFKTIRVTDATLHVEALNTNTHTHINNVQHVLFTHYPCKYQSCCKTLGVIHVWTYFVKTQRLYCPALQLITLWSAGA